MARLQLRGVGSPEELAAEVLCHEKILLMTDYDGTLVPIAEKPELAVASSALRSILQKLSEKDRLALAIISGRDLAELCALLPLRGSHLIGCHGTQSQDPTGKRQCLFATERLWPVLNLVMEQAQRCVGRYQGFLVEGKDSAVALHYRLAEPRVAAEVLSQFAQLVQPWLLHYDLELLSGKKVVEVRPRGVNKGVAIKHLLNLYPGYFPVYFGDDTTDEDAFAVVRTCGMGVLIAKLNRATLASYRLFQQSDLVNFLQILLARC